MWVFITPCSTRFKEVERSLVGRGAILMLMFLRPKTADTDLSVLYPLRVVHGFLQVVIQAPQLPSCREPPIAMASMLPAPNSGGGERKLSHSLASSAQNSSHPLSSRSTRKNEPRGHSWIQEKREDVALVPVGSAVSPRCGRGSLHFQSGAGYLRVGMSARHSTGPGRSSALP